MKLSRNAKLMRPFYRYGGSSPVVRGSVVLDLHRMKKIIEINEEYAYAIVEPGVTFLTFMKKSRRRASNSGHLFLLLDGAQSWEMHWSADSGIHPRKSIRRCNAAWRSSCRTENS